MTLQDLIHQFTLMNKRAPLHVNELLDYLQKNYIHGEICIRDYKHLFGELNKHGAKKAEMFAFANKFKMDKQAL